MKFFTTLFIFICVSFSAYSLTIKEAIEEALELNYDIKLEEQKLLSETHRVGGGKSLYYPKIDLSYIYSNSSYGGIEAPQPDSSEYSELSATVSYNIFNGFKNKSNVDILQKNVTIQEYAVDIMKIDLEYQVKRAYVSYLMALHGVENAEQALILHEKQRDDIKYSVENGLKSNNDLLQAEVQLAIAQQDLLSRVSDAELALSNLSTLISRKVESSEIDVNSERKLWDHTSDSLPPHDELLSKMLTNRSELKQLVELRSSVESGRTAAKGDYYPRVDLSAGYSLYGDSFTPSGRDNTYDDELRYGVSVSWRVFDGFGTSSSVKSYSSQMYEVTHQINGLKNTLELQLDAAIIDYGLSVEMLDTVGTTLAQSEENYRVTLESYEQSVSTTTELLDASTNMTKAKNDVADAYYGMLLAIIELERVVEEPLIKVEK